MNKQDIEKIETIIDNASNGEFDKIVNKKISEGWVLNSKISYFDSESYILGAVAVVKMKEPQKQMVM